MIKQWLSTGLLCPMATDYKHGPSIYPASVLAHRSLREENGMEQPAITHIHFFLEKYTKICAFLVGKLGSPMLSHPMWKTQNMSLCSSCDRLAAIVPEWLDRLDLLHEPWGLPFSGGGSRRPQYDFRS